MLKIKSAGCYLAKGKILDRHSLSGNSIRIHPKQSFTIVHFLSSIAKIKRLIFAHCCWHCALDPSLCYQSVDIETNLLPDRLIVCLLIGGYIGGLVAQLKKYFFANENISYYLNKLSQSLQRYKPYKSRTF